MDYSTRRMTESESARNRKQFKFALNEVYVYHTLLRKHPGGAIPASIADDADMSTQEAAKNLKKLMRRGLAKRRVDGRTHLYTPLPPDNRGVREIFEKYDDPMDAYFALDNVWINWFL